MQVVDVDDNGHGAVSTSADQRQRPVLRDDAGRPRTSSRHAARRPPQAIAVLRPRQERVLFRPAPAELRGDLPLLPVRRKAATAAARAGRRLPRRAALLPAGVGRGRGVQAVRGLHGHGGLESRSIATSITMSG